ncbi:BON domain-containing protein [Comamonas thiooxydans]|uniref:BON domain-containing protein n=1 Tax=Comamonas thiooxydans TaxID=363952 RepID=UPI000B408943|nr:BON domain-containing protein [Comamonas thiooxydans]
MKILARAAVALCVVAHLAGCAIQRDQQSIGTYVDDVTITTTIKTKFAADPIVSAAAIKVETLHGVVQLSGFAASAAEKDAAVSIARLSRNVVQVVDSIVLPHQKP